MRLRLYRKIWDDCLFMRGKESDSVKGVLFVLPMLGKDTLASPSARMRNRFVVVLVVGDICCV